MIGPLRRAARFVVHEPLAWLEAAISAMPGALGSRTRAGWMSWRLGALGAGARLEEGIVVSGHGSIRVGARFYMMRNGGLYARGGSLVIGDDVGINTNVYVGAEAGSTVAIGDRVMIGPNTVLHAVGHGMERDVPMRNQPVVPGALVIEPDVWIGANCMIMPVTIGAHAVVAAGAVVTKDVAPWSIVAGVPAREIGKRG